MNDIEAKNVADQLLLVPILADVSDSIAWPLLFEKHYGSLTTVLACPKVQQLLQKRGWQAVFLPGKGPHFIRVDNGEPAKEIGAMVKENELHRLMALLVRKLCAGGDASALDIPIQEIVVSARNNDALFCDLMTLIPPPLVNIIGSQLVTALRGGKASVSVSQVLDRLRSQTTPHNAAAFARAGCACVSECVRTEAHANYPRNDSSSRGEGIGTTTYH